MHRKTVWIVGAGFSRSLGGPLLDDLLSGPSIQFAQTLYGANPFLSASSPTGIVRSLFENCGPDATAPGRRLWRDAEAFLDHLDAAASNEMGPAAKRLQMAKTIAFANPSGGSNWPEVRTAARRLVAAACSSFLLTTGPEEERWQPYHAWARELEITTDTVVSFNYDRVLELLIGKPKRDRGFQVFPPNALSDVEQIAPYVFKLHGSVDWKREEKDNAVTYSVQTDPEFALTCDPDAIGIATPGPGKRIAVQELARVWEEAGRRAKKAEIIVFVGYRFPPSDAEARTKLLDWIRENESPHLELHAILGLERPGDVGRLEGLLRSTCLRAGRTEGRPNRALGNAIYDANGLASLRTFKMTVHALYAEDFFTVWDRDALFPPSIDKR
jgi:hypothetical protein